MVKSRWAPILLLVATLSLASPAAALPAASFIVVNASVIDGTGAPARPGALRVRGGRIESLGNIVPAQGELIIDARGLVLAPGFIDSHSHHDLGLDKSPDALVALSQGITTIVVGQDGSSQAPLAKIFADFERLPASLNLASYSGHGTLRSAAMGKDYKREATPAEVGTMQRLLTADLRAGGLGLSTGLEYDPGLYSSLSEVIALARTAAAHKGRYISHIRSEDVAIGPAIEEIIEVGRQARLPVQVSHMKLAIVDRWGTAKEFLERLDRARAEGVEITADVYPYEFWQSNLSVLFPKRDYTDLAASEFALAHMARPEGIVLTDYSADPAIVGKSLAEIAKSRGKPAAQVYLDLINASPTKGEEDTMIATSMTTADIADLMAWPHSNVASDGMLAGTHPRGAGSFPKVLAWLVRADKKLSLETAVHKMSGLTAAHMGFVDRGTLEPGMAADLVLFDPSTTTDHATLDQPRALSTGIDCVWVNGVLVFADGKATGKRPGRVIRRHSR